MALKSTIFKADLAVADIDRGYYRDHVLRIAQHPSETHERMMVRLLAFALHADDALEFGRGLSHRRRARPLAARPDGRHRAVDRRRASRRARGAQGVRARRTRSRVLAYGGRAVDLWWQERPATLARLDRLAVSEVPIEASRALAGLAGRTMRLQVTIQEGHIFVADGATSVPVELQVLKRARPRLIQCSAYTALRNDGMATGRQARFNAKVMRLRTLLAALGCAATFCAAAAIPASRANDRGRVSTMRHSTTTSSRPIPARSAISTPGSIRAGRAPGIASR